MMLSNMIALILSNMTTFDSKQSKLNKKDFQIALGKRIRQLREEKKISQTELGNLCEIERSNMNRIESGNTNPSSYLLYQIAQKLGVEPNELLNFRTLDEFEKQLLIPIFILMVLNKITEISMLLLALHLFIFTNYHYQKNYTFLFLYIIDWGKV